ncbi:MAG: anaerobic ribonucleoside-triphosphate reductase activating protein [Clostridiales bacterium]|nr:anaerobic ribonucleoside-triphosphate reductase activating protein [Clostridiales bacterium]
MDINGIQKLTLLDYPGRVACTVFLSGCDLRCPYCHNSELWTGSAPSVMDENEFFDFLKKRKGMLEGVCITGGEPTLRKELYGFIKGIKELGYSVKLDSNGFRPDALARLISDRLVDYIAMDIKNDPARYALTSGLEKLDLGPVYESIGLLKESGVDYEFRTTVVKELHDLDSFVNIGRMIEGADRYFLQPFTDRDTVKFSGFHAPEAFEMKEYLETVRPHVKHAEIRGME